MMKRVGKISGQPVLYEETDYVDTVGTRRTMHEFIKRKEDGTRVRIPFRPPVVTKNYTKGTILFGADETRRLTDGEIIAHFHINRPVIETA